MNRSKTSFDSNRPRGVRQRYCVPPFQQAVFHQVLNRNTDVLDSFAAKFCGQLQQANALVEPQPEKKTFLQSCAARDAADLSGAGAAFGAVTQVGPLVTVLIVAGAGATAMCADLGSRTIREEIDAMEVLGINPVQRLVTPRMLACGLVALLLNSLVVIIGIVGGYIFSVFVQDVNPGAFAAGITLLTGVPEVIISCVKAALFGLIAGLVACYRGLTVSGGAKAVGNAVNETVVYAFMALFVINVVVTAIGIRFSSKSP